jgi:hypothetical protein
MSDHGMAKMEMDVAEEGRCYDLGILVKQQDEDVELQQQPARKKVRVNNPANHVSAKSKRVFQKKFNGFASWPVLSL